MKASGGFRFANLNPQRNGLTYMSYDTGPGIGICINKTTVLTHDESLKGLAKRQNGTTKKIFN
ncbi:MAG: hypothetical protein A2X93_02130 [Deltaproteobacteria bacterium GWC2_56_8]|nr:MAG: hypothetical protein A2X99_06850 [Deltaproteobacteria bacterium GWB2_55_19]OGP33486.1 MAG: hypothetical protein A2X93_02130 [Deltaproteobacteria bacterium GWC2_56_8]HAO94116.1 hypothetical protein [Deltaproteobacteria bacterium]